MPAKTPSGRAVLTVLVLGAVCAVLAQYQLNPQLNTELYGRGVGSVRSANLPFHQAALTSDWRHNAFLSGSLRSDIRGQYLLQGPLAPSGPTAYIPATPLRPYATTPRLPAPAPLVNRPLSVPRVYAQPALPSGSYRYPSAGRPLVLPPAPSTAPTGVGPVNLTPFQTSSYGSIRYGR